MSEQAPFGHSGRNRNYSNDNQKVIVETSGEEDVDLHSK
jgi:hypothetical protein